MENIEAVAFWCFAVLALVCVLVMLFSKKALNYIISAGLFFVILGGIFFVLHAPLNAVIQMVLGVISAIFLVFLQKKLPIKKRENSKFLFSGRKFFGSISIFIIFCAVLLAIIGDYFSNILNLYSGIGLYHYLILALVMFSLGLFGCVVCKNLVKIILCFQIMLNAVALNFISYAIFNDTVDFSGGVFAITLSVFGVLQLILGGFFVFAVCRYKKSVDVDKMVVIKG